MGKDDDKGQSRDDLKEEHNVLVAREQELKEHYNNVKAIFQKLDEAYQVSKGSFSLQRYSQLKDMIKGATNEATINTFKRVTDESSLNGRCNITSLVEMAKELSSEAQQQQEAAAGQANSGKKSRFGFFKKLKNITGFSDEPIADEDVMSNTELQRDNGRKQRSVQRLKTQITQAISKLEKLRHSYEASKAHAPPKRYVELKEMIKTTVAQPLP